MGLDVKAVNAIGDWSDGAENTLFAEVRGGTYEDIRYSAAVKGEIANQKAVIPFQVSKNGPDSLYRFSMSGKLEDIRGNLDKGGIAFRTLIPNAKGAEVIVFDPKSALYGTIEKFSDTHDLSVRQYHGHGEFLGSDSTRTAGRAAYRKVIAEYEVSHSTHYRSGRARVSDIGGKSAATEGLAKSPGDFDESLHPRDEDGKWTDGGGGHEKLTLKSTTERAWNGKTVEVKTQLSKLETGALGESIVVAYLKQEGMLDARTADMEHNNYPVDLVQDHGAIEVKTGLVSNGSTAQHWRATIGQPSKTEREWLKTASREEKRDWNKGKGQDILARKQEALKELGHNLGGKMTGSTFTLLLNPDTRTADLFRFEGFHLRIPFNSPQAKAGYIGSYRY